MNRIVLLGSSNTDMVIKTARLPAPGETVLGGSFLMNPGGKGANQAVAAARLGGEVTFIARVGDDLFGKDAIQGYQRHGINTAYISTDTAEPSGIATIMVDADGENCIAVAPGANDRLSPGHVDKAAEAFSHADVVLMQLETPLETVQRAARLGKDNNSIVILNPAPASQLPDELLAIVDVLTPNETEAALLTGMTVASLQDVERAAESLHARGVATVIVTLGARGAYVSAREFTGLVPAGEVQAVDTTAAGDTFNGALAVALAKGKTISDAAEFAVKAATISVTRMGAQASIPSLEELDGS